MTNAKYAAWKKNQNFNSFLNSVWEWEWLDWSCIFLEEGLFTVWIRIGSWTYFISLSMSVRTAMYSCPTVCRERSGWQVMHKHYRSLNAVFDVYSIRLSTTYLCVSGTLSQHLQLLAGRRSCRRSVPLLLQQNVFFAVMFPVFSLG